MTAAEGPAAHEKLLHCSFCGKNQHEAAGFDVFICNNCVDLCNEMVAEFREEKEGVKNEQPTELG
ncbi:MAG: hypothetical protein H5U32_02530 [Pseudomonas balearica]|nr:hypothetical protein [Stutzerimonas balearica]